MIHKTYEFVCQLPAPDALERIKGLLIKESVKYSTDNLSVTSTQTPIVIFGFDPRRYSRANWTGRNPFTYVSSVEIRCEPDANGLTRVIARVNRLRAFVWLAFWVACSALAVYAMRELGGAIVFIGVACAAGFGGVSFLSVYLIKKEIGDHLKDGDHD